MSRKKLTEEERITSDKQRVLKVVTRFGPIPVSRVKYFTSLSFAQAHYCLDELIREQKIRRQERVNATNGQVIEDYAAATEAPEVIN